MDNTIIELKNLSLIFKNGNGAEVKALDGVNLKIKEGEFITVVGRNGAGKSSLLRAIAEYTPTKGYIFYNANDVSEMSHHKRARFIRYVAQNTSDIVSDAISLEEQFSQALNVGGWLSLRKALTNKVRTKVKEELGKLDMGLENRLSENIGNLSGGERQAIALLMATASKPGILLLDEHTAALDFKNTITIEEITERLIRETSLTTLWVTHNLEQAVKYGNRILVINKGNVILDILDAERKEISKDKLTSLINKYDT
jgi:putative ABC transport system ATP-binding protein